jgi:ATP-dependent Clp protease ATP-binding subunit ClpA
MATEVYVFFGPDKAFDELVASHTEEGDYTVSYLDAIRVYNTKVRATQFVTPEAFEDMPEKVDNCVVRSTDFGSVLSHVVSSFARILESTFEMERLFVQNPPSRALRSLESACGESGLEVINHEYPRLRREDLPTIYDSLRANVLGQRESKRALITSLYKLIVMSDERPSVVLFYGPSGVGKTETGKCLSEAVGGGLTRVQFSMMQTTEAYEYLFGAEHSKASFARDLLGRESNVVLIDEFDKVQPSLYNMFYQLFDEGKYVDTNYEVDARSVIFLLTSNFSTESAARRALGPAMFSRIGVCIGFEDLDPNDKATIATNRYNEVIERLNESERETIEGSDILPWFQGNADRYDNMRTLKNKVEKAIFEKLSEPILDESIRAYRHAEQ